MRSAGIAVQPQAAGGSADLGDGVTLTVLSPPPVGYVGENASNRNSLVARLSYGSFSALLTGDADTDAEAALLASHTPLAATILKVGHHGSRSSTSPTFAAGRTCDGRGRRAPICLTQSSEP
jgi:competence protein ComEC